MRATRRPRAGAIGTGRVAPPGRAPQQRHLTDDPRNRTPASGSTRRAVRRAARPARVGASRGQASRRSAEPRLRWSRPYRGAMTRLRRAPPLSRGWTRRASGTGFTYLDADGHRLAVDDVARIRSLAISPAWSDVWIRPTPTATSRRWAPDAGRLPPVPLPPQLAGQAVAGRHGLGDHRYAVGGDDDFVRQRQDREGLSASRGRQR